LEKKVSVIRILGELFFEIIYKTITTVALFHTFIMTPINPVLQPTVVMVQSNNLRSSG